MGEVAMSIRKVMFNLFGVAFDKLFNYMYLDDYRFCATEVSTFPVDPVVI